MSALKRTSLEVAAAAWGTNMPDWVEVLAKACDDTSQKKMAARLGKSQSTINLVLNRRYNASLDAIENLVRGHLMMETVPCPVVGDIAIDQCRENQRIQPTPLERRLFGRACPTCPHRKGA